MSKKLKVRFSVLPLKAYASLAMIISLSRNDIVMSEIPEMLEAVSGKRLEFQANGTPCIRVVV